MIKINSISINEIRGIRTISLPLNAKSFVIAGDNGTGKSGVVDAIEFGLTGKISRLAGAARGNVSLKAHGPHVIHKSEPEFAEVKIEVLLTKSGDVVTLTRNMKNPDEYVLTPDSSAARTVIDEIGQHPEIVLSRREIVDLIITRPTERSVAVQKLLKLDNIDETRKALLGAARKLKEENEAAIASRDDARNSLASLEGANAYNTQSILDFLNLKRKALGLEELPSLTDSEGIVDGLSDALRTETFNKQAALSDIDTATEGVSAAFPAHSETCREILESLRLIEESPALLELISTAELISLGLTLITSASCPLCDTEWNSLEELRQYLEEKISKSADATDLQEKVLNAAKPLSTAARTILGYISSLERLGTHTSSPEYLKNLALWKSHIETFIQNTSTLVGIIALKAEIAAGWPQIPTRLATAIASERIAIEAKPDQSATVDAASALTKAEERFAALSSAEEVLAASNAAAEIASQFSEAYVAVSSSALETLYGQVEADFSRFYRMINGDDEADFSAAFRQSKGKLDLEVDFYGRGNFPPSAYHSEGHQDGMGVCLYLALMKQLLPDQFEFAVLDDVVMSIDAGHRKRFLQLLLTEFPDTQFVMTTHDRFWARQIRHVLTGPHAGVLFTSWSVDSGPVFEADEDIWDRVEEDLAKSDVSSAAARTRNYLEFLFAELADDLGAEVKFSSEGSYDLGELWSPTIGRYSRLLGLAGKSATKFGQKDVVAAISERRQRWSAALVRYGDENWVINKVLHNNDWANATVDEFRDVVDSIKSVLFELRCQNPPCKTWLYVTPHRGTLESVGCRCGNISLNLSE